MTAVVAGDTTVSGFRGNAWVRYAARRGGRFLVSLWVLITASFLMIHLIPGDPVRAALGIRTPASVIEAKREALGLNDPLWLQYLDYLSGLFTGDLGTSMSNNLNVAQVISDRFPSTLELALYAFLAAAILSVPLGLVMGVLTRGGRRRHGELAFTSSTSVLAAIPEFLLAVGLVYVFAVWFQVLPVAGRSGPESYILPVLSLAAGPAAVLARIVRLEMLAVLSADYIRTARAKRLRPWLIYVRHALPNALTASITLGGLLLSGMVAGTVLVETVFAWPGLGSTIVQSILAKDYPVVQAVVLVYGFGVLIVNLVVDVVLALLDPRSTIMES